MTPAFHVSLKFGIRPTKLCFHNLWTSVSEVSGSFLRTEQAGDKVGRQESLTLAPSVSVCVATRLDGGENFIQQSSSV